jgi:anti-sigma regulatory factor (Ser/Thr protein kinase)
MRDEQLVLFSSRDEYMRATFIGAEDANRLGVEALAAVPLFTASGDVVGCLNIGWSQPVDFNADHLDTLDEFGRIVSRAVERVRVADLERDVARTLQLGLLANEARSTAAVVRSRYLAADATMAIGGDWYDVIELPDGRLVIAVGDVVGQGLAAATTMGQLRAALGMCVLTTSDPAEAITMLDRFAEHVPGASCATVALTVIDPAREVLTHFRAGHPPPLVVPPGGAPQYLEGGHSWPLQVGVSDPRGETGVAPFPAGSLLVLYTDGLIERRHEDLSVGLDRLAGVVARGAAWPLAELERTVVDELVAQPASDDIAILTVRTVAARPNFLATAIKSKPAELWRARHRIDHWLRNHDVPDDTRDGFALAIGEALTNAIEHGNGGDERNIAQVELAIMNDEMVATIRDAGRWQTGAEGFLSGRGRGHMLMHAMVDSLEVDNDHQGTVVTLRSRTADREPAA